MPAFKYESRDRNGRALSGTLEANDASGVAASLAQQGMIPLRIVPMEPSKAARAQQAAASASGAAAAAAMNLAASKSAARKSAQRNPANPEIRLDALLAFLPPALRPGPRRRVSDVELQLMTRELAAMLKAGVPIMRSLALLQESSSNVSLADSLGNIANDLDSGLELAVAMERESQRSRLFPSFYVSMIRVAEATGRLEEGLLSLARQLQFLRETREQVSAALRYPTFVLTATFGAVAIVNIFVIPQFERVFKGMNAKLPLLTQVLLSTSKLFVTGWPFLLAGVLASVVGWRVWVGTPRGSHWRDRMILKLPIVGDIVRRISLSRFATSLATALRSGVPVAQALTIVAETIGNKVFSEGVETMRSRVERGESLRAAGAMTGLFPPVLQQVISVGEETGALEELLGEIGTHYQSEVEYAIGKLSARIEPILIVLLGAIVLVLALGVFMPMWEMGRASLGKS